MAFVLIDSVYKLAYLKRTKKNCALHLEYRNPNKHYT